MFPFDVEVIYAVYGALKDGLTFTEEVSEALEKSIKDTNDGYIVIENDALGGDPCPGVIKHFGAKITIAGVPIYYACEEHERINFYSTAK